jgi:acyl-CoA hydrolase
LAIISIHKTERLICSLNAYITKRVLTSLLFDLILNDAESTHNLFAPPNMKVSLQDYAIGLYARPLAVNGGTPKIGIGSLGDTIAQSLLLRDQQNPLYRDLIGDLFAR